MITIDTIKLYQMLVQSERPIEENKQHFTIIENQMFENSSSFQREPLNNTNLRLWSSLKPDGVYRAKLNSIKVKIQTVRSIYFKIKGSCFSLYFILFFICFSLFTNFVPLLLHLPQTPYLLRYPTILLNRKHQREKEKDSTLEDQGLVHRHGSRVLLLP